MVRSHKAQLFICHEPIKAYQPRCDLRAYAWCYDDDYYVCDLHWVSRHFEHHIVKRSDEKRGKA